MVKKYFKGKDTAQIVALVDKICEEKLQPFIDQSYQELAELLNSYEQKMFMKREAIADQGIWCGKKRYLLSVWNNEGVAYAKPKIKVTGLDSVRSTTAVAAKQAIEASYEILLNGTEDEMQAYYEKVKNNWNSLSVADIAIGSSVQGLSKYKINDSGLPINHRSALVHNIMIDKLNLGDRLEKIKDGEKIKMVHLNIPNPAQSKVIGFVDHVPKEFGIERYIAYDLMFEKALGNILTDLCSVVGWSPVKIATLDDFFS